MTGLLAQLELTRPAWLAALLVVALVALSSRGAADVPRWRRWAEVACRCLLLALLIVALCRPVWHRRHAIRSVVFAVDVSASIDQFLCEPGAK